MKTEDDKTAVGMVAGREMEPEGNSGSGNHIAKWGATERVGPKKQGPEPPHRHDMINPWMHN